MSFQIIAIIIILCWISGVVFLALGREGSKKKKWGEILFAAGIGAIALYMVFLWIWLKRPPLRTLGETRLWYVFFLSLTGMVLYAGWKMRWMIFYSLFLSLLFLMMNVVHPENFDKTLMPALQSVWFVPHVIVYMFAYALLGASMLVAVKGLWLSFSHQSFSDLSFHADRMVRIGFAFLTFGLLFGALWAKEAWGQYWSWDPKETWAFITWLIYLLYIHFRYHRPGSEVLAMWLLLLAFVLLIVCWMGINYLPSAQSSIHTYTR